MAETAVLQGSVSFPVGTTVEARKASNWSQAQLPPSGTSPPGAADTSAAVAADGTLTFTGLVANTRYYAYASVGGAGRYVGFATGEAGASATVPNVEIASALPAGTNSIGTVDTELPTPAALSDGSVADGATTTFLAAKLLISNADGSGSNFVNSAKNDGRNPDKLMPAVGYAIKDSTSAGADRLRTPSVFKPLATTAITAGTGATIWTPAGGKKFRVMGITFSTSAAGQLLLGDNLVATVIARSPSLAAGGAWVLGATDLGNGILSALANNVLKMDGPTGNIMGMVWGTEE